MRITSTFFLLVFLTVALYGADYTKSSTVSEEIWNEVKPYLLPQKHPAKPVLDYASKRARLTANRQTLQAAGFEIRTCLKSRMIVASHPKMKNYLIKTFLDTHNVFNQDWALWKRRAAGAQILREAIQQYGYTHLFKVPRKWIYPLPDFPAPLQASGQFPQHFLLVVEEMDVNDSKKNAKFYNEKITAEMLDGLFALVKDFRLVDSLHLSNIPVCKDGKIAFVDTEYVNTTWKKVPYDRLSKHLSPEMKKHWRNLIKKER